MIQALMIDSPAEFVFYPLIPLKSLYDEDKSSKKF